MRSAAPDFLIVLVVLLIIAVIALLIWVNMLRARLAGSDASRTSAGPDSSRTLVPPLVALPDSARTAALQGMTDAGLLRRPDWTARLALPNVPLTPLLVRRLDAVDPAFAYYYLVPFGKDDGSVTAVAMVDGISTEFLECSPMKSSAQWGLLAAEWRTVESTRRQIQIQRGATKPLDVRVEDTFIWTPCAESQSQNYPFRMVLVDGQTQYIRIDGKVFDKLTPLVPGGGTPESYSDDRRARGAV